MPLTPPVLPGPLWLILSDQGGGIIISAGRLKLHEQTPEAIRLYDKLLLALSEDSIRISVR
jgi:hypothetical protein